MSEEDEDQEELEEAPEPAKSGKKKLIIIAALTLVLLGGGGAGLYFTGIIGSSPAKEAEQGPPKGKQTASIELPGPPVYYELPSILVDLKTDKCRSPFLKTTIIIELSSTDKTKLEEAQVPFMERVQEFIREHRRIHLVGKVGSDRLKAGIAIIANNFIAPSKVISVLFKEFILQ